MNYSKKKICFAASSGGHLEEISRLLDIKKENDVFLITEYTGMQEKRFDKVYYVRQVNRKECLLILHLLKIFGQTLKIFFREKPDLVISTGALVTVPICILAKLMKKKVIYIESFARVEKPSLTGKLMYRIADLFIVQWRELLNYYSNAVYTGGIF